MRFDDAATVIGGTLRPSSIAAAPFTGVSIDSRTVTAGQLFVAIRGARTDGHRYWQQAVDQGAAGLIVEHAYPELSSIPEQVPVIVVRDSHEAMIALAITYRERVAARRAGITGSNGKTTTKEMTAALLQAIEPQTYKSAGNLNNLFGMPLALLAMPLSTKYAVLEMGISTPDEMSALARVAAPHVGVITNVGPTHLEFLGTVENVAREKLQLLSHSGADAPLVINADDPVLYPMAKQQKRTIVTFGFETHAQIRPESHRLVDGHTEVTINGYRYRVPLFGTHQVYNLLAAVGVVEALGLSLKGIDTEKIVFETAPMRGQTVRHGEITWILDCYNANPESVRLGLETFGQTPVSGRRVLILGDMLELGSESAMYHRRVGHQISQQPVDLIILVGPQMRMAADNAVAEGVAAAVLYHFDSVTQAQAPVRELLRAGDVVYLKGSRGIGLERLYDAVREGELR